MSDASGDGLRRAFERAAAERGQSAGESAREGIRVVIVSVAGEWYALRLSDLVEIVGAVDPTPIPFAPRSILGVINHRGAIVPVFDLRRVLGLPAHYRAGSFRTALVSIDGTTLGLQVDSIASIESLPQDALEPPLEVMEPSRAMLLEGCARVSRGLVGLISARALLEALKAQRPS